MLTLVVSADMPKTAHGNRLSFIGCRNPKRGVKILVARHRTEGSSLFDGMYFHDLKRCINSLF